MGAVQQNVRGLAANPAARAVADLQPTNHTALLAAAAASLRARQPACHLRGMHVHATRSSNSRRPERRRPGPPRWPATERAPPEAPRSATISQARHRARRTPAHQALNARLRRPGTLSPTLGNCLNISRSCRCRSGNEAILAPQLLPVGLTACSPRCRR